MEVCRTISRRGLSGRHSEGTSLLKSEVDLLSRTSRCASRVSCSPATSNAVRTAPLMFTRSRRTPPSWMACPNNSRRASPVRVWSLYGVTATLAALPLASASNSPIQPGSQPPPLVPLRSRPRSRTVSRSRHLLVKLDFEFPAPGRYRLDLNPEGGTPDDVFPFWIDTAVDNSDTPTIVGDNPTTTVEVVTSSDDPASEWFRNPLVERSTWSWKIYCLQHDLTHRAASCSLTKMSITLQPWTQNQTSETCGRVGFFHVFLVRRAQFSQTVVNRRRECLVTRVLHRLQAFFLDELPHPLDQVQVRRIRRQEQQMDFQGSGQLLDQGAFLVAGIVQHQRDRTPHTGRSDLAQQNAAPRWR